MRPGHGFLWIHSNVHLTAAGFVLSVETVGGEVAHLALLDALVVAAGKPGAGAGWSRGGAATCQRVSHQLLPKLETISSI